MANPTKSKSDGNLTRLPAEPTALDDFVERIREVERTPYAKLDVHPAANLFPLMGEADLQSLADDIRRHGQREWCVFYQDQLIDGRNRWRACELLGIEPIVCELDADDDFDAVGYVLSANLHRRHLTTGQRAMVAAKARAMYDAAAKERQGTRNDLKNIVENLPPSQKARDAAGKAAGVSGRTVDHAAAVLERGSADLIGAVERGDVAISRAAKVAKSTPKKKQMAAVVNETPPKKAKEFLLIDCVVTLYGVIDNMLQRWPDECRELIPLFLRRMADEIEEGRFVALDNEQLIEAALAFEAGQKEVEDVEAFA